ncbi:Sigma-70, region 4 [Desulfofundulus australicus DSM 11792]|uniref:Sigma-70, region 4 n=1 Tax=Desulfofundulus australicus DSM 11792 TaxID=1121425 RepID=A0A1M4XF23_9FIRM|nr:sigma factor-like helix-turn-helix DNA-binding protein [Desulfofundulus australicus]SHE92109.1 Sigma-70, region 4 [Desulfofundulus australicus DSM 11792]
MATQMQKDPMVAELILRKSRCVEEQHDFREVVFPSLDEADHVNIEVRDFLNHPSLSKNDREILFYLMEGRNAREIAMMKGISVNLVRVHISRARARARKLWGRLERNYI